MGKHARALPAALDTAWNVDEVRHAAAEVFQTHPDYASSPTSGGLRIPPAPACSPRSAMTAPGSPRTAGSRSSRRWSTSSIDLDGGLNDITVRAR